MWEARYLPESKREYFRLPGAEQAAMGNFVRKLEALGLDLGYPHSSSVREIPGLRELRPRQGRSPWRAL